SGSGMSDCTTSVLNDSSTAPAIDTIVASHTEPLNTSCCGLSSRLKNIRNRIDSRLIGDTTVTGAIDIAMYRNICEKNTRKPENVNHLAASRSVDHTCFHCPGHSRTSENTIVAAI